jgi:hypothetical protein
LYLGDYISIEEIEGDGIATINNDILLKPSDVDSGDNAVDVGVANNQFTQLYHPTYDLATGESYSCGVVHDTSDATISEAITVRCWGSNYIFNGPDTDSSNQFDLGVLNNNGHSYFYNPSTDAYSGFMWAAANSNCYTGTPGNEYNSSVCEFVNHFKMIGDDFSDYFRIDYYYLAVLGGTFSTYEKGFTDGFPGTLNAIPGINHEMHANSQSKFDFGALFGTLDDIKIYGGAHHVCSVPIVNGVTSGDNNKMRCWGANHVGQAGINWVDGAGCDPDIVGGLWSCGIGNGETKTFNYSF